MKGSNELYDDDIENFVQALSYEKKIMPLLEKLQKYLVNDEG
jgi:hypothetical protein